jgi:Dolichyl-phosphate-mannose-protein mannosyltransferase
MKAISIKIFIFSILLVVFNFTIHYSFLFKDVSGFHAWRQSWTQTNIKYFSTTENNILNPTINNLDLGNNTKICRYEFPIYQWMIAKINLLFGYQVLNSRLFSLLLYLLGAIFFGALFKLLFNESYLFFISAWIFCWLPINYFYSITIIPDILSFNFSVLSLYLLIIYLNTNHKIHFVVSVLFWGLAVLQKLPYIIFLPSFVLAIYYSDYKIKNSFYLFIVILPSIIWYSMVIKHWQSGFTSGLLSNETYTIKNLVSYLYFYLAKCFPIEFIGIFNIPIFIYGVYVFFKHKISSLNNLHKIFLISLPGMLLFFLFELNVLNYSHDYYLFFFVPYFIYFIILGFQNSKLPFQKFSLICFLTMPLMATIFKNKNYTETHPRISEAVIANKNNISKIIPKDAICIVGNDVSGHVLLYYLNHTSYTFSSNWLPLEKFLIYKQTGASYLITDNTIVIIQNGLENFVTLQSQISGIFIYKIN